MNRRYVARLRALLNVGRVAGLAALPVLDLVARLGVGKSFFVSGMLKASNWPVALELARFEYPLPGIDPTTEAVAGFLVELLGSVLLMAGFLTRPAAAAMLVLALTSQIAYRQVDTNLFWIAVLGWQAVRGPGAISIDSAIAGGLRNSAAPFAETTLRIGAWLSQRLGPPFDLALRLWLAASLAGLSPPDVFATETLASLPSAFRLTAALLLAVGFATRPVAVVLGLWTLAVWASMTGGASPFYAALIFALLAGAGAGPLSLDAVVRRFVEQAARRPDPPPRVVIVGAGFAGVSCVQGLREEGADITLIDRNNYHLFQPLLYQVATAGLSPADIAAPVRAMFRDDPAIRVLRGTVTGIDIEARSVKVDGRDLAYDYLVLATGATHSYFGREDWRERAPGLKRLEDAVLMRARVLDAFERAEASLDPQERLKLLTFVICGGGPTGVELAGAIADLARFGLADEFRKIVPASARVVLIQAAPRLLPTFPEELSRAAFDSLARMGVEVRLNSRVEDVGRDAVVVNGERIETATALWAAGVVASPAARWLEQPADASGRLKVGPDLTVPGHPQIFAVGDTASAIAWNGGPAPGLAPAAKQAGAYVARVLRARFDNAPAPAPFRYRHWGSLATIGRKSAVADLGFVRLKGATAWWFWGAAHLLLLVGARNRASVLLSWLWAYATYRVGVQLITGVEKGEAV
ncbi:MAG: FAD-dependent oxidoreductase [Roseiarcus sp.]|uniref:FAD-dependent oxidoreductase n=2 Tax=Roseiarcus sp. TaxID=1969460 RepID=UPI003C41EAD0